MIQSRHSALRQSIQSLVALGAIAHGIGIGSALAQHDRQHLDRVLEPLVIPAPEKVTVVTGSTPVVSPVAPIPKETPRLTAGNILSAIQKQIVEHFDLVGDLSLTMAREWRPIPLPEGNFTLEITEYPEGVLKTNFTVKCRITAEGGRLIGEWPIGLKAQLWREVWIASDRINRGTAIDRQLLSTRRVDVLREGEGLLGSNIDLSNFEVSESIAAGRGISRKDIAERPLVRKNQIVEVTAQKGGLSITMKAQALESGSANALIRVRNMDSRKEFNAQVIDAHRVQIAF